MPYSYPESVANLLIHLGQSESSPSFWYEGKEIVQGLLEMEGLEPETKQQLTELEARQGWQ